jgi:outer membrane lipoprotein-sorting protein
LEGRAVYVIESQPKDEVVKNHSGYSKQIIWVDKENHLPLKTDFWDENANLLKTIHVSDVKPSDVNGHWHFIHLEAENHQNGHKTQLQLDSFQANQGLNAELFTPSNLEKDD